MSWLAQPISIPFVSDLYRALTGDDLSLLDLTCLLAAVPATILLDVLTGSPTVAGTEDDTLTSGADAGQILLGLANFALGIAGSSLDLGLLCVMDQWSSLAPVNPRPNPLLNFLNYVDFALDFIGWALGVVVSYGWVAWEARDWIFWGVQGAPQLANFVYLFRSDSNNDKQVARDTVTGVAVLILSAVYAHFWPASYCDAPKAKGLVLTSNIFGSISSISEAPLLVGDPWTWLALVIPVKITGYVVSDVLGLTAYVLGLVD